MAAVLVERLKVREYWHGRSPSTVEIEEDARLRWVDRQKAAAYLPLGRLLCRLSTAYLPSRGELGRLDRYNRLLGVDSHLRKTVKPVAVF